MKIAVVVGSVRENRVSDRLAKWVVDEVGKLANVETIDLKDYPMPFMDEAISPRFNPERQPVPEVKRWLDKIAEFDGYVFVTPEYNRSTSGVLKNAIDYLDFQMEKKPVALVAHGSTGGAQAVASLRMALPGVGAVTVPQALFFTDWVAKAIDEEGMLKEELSDAPHGPQSSLKTQVETLIWYVKALKNARTA
ncbi:MAG TPA: NAD(P)H-dependent oxidoreductase [Candidatus Saccharibacteria bacterium]|nr:NAD(P)H-dependent oxidoreductase [Candidatus Saccharibacteria bacterium]HRK94065.1 NAD(P)H-dependent oxidoreductase [Candidatus Saccharibacteria bacterium]